MNKFVIDDKGMLLLACFGLPPLSHFGDDPARATLASMRMLDTLRAEGCTGIINTWSEIWGREYVGDSQGG